MSAPAPEERTPEPAPRRRTPRWRRLLRGLVGAAVVTLAGALALVAIDRQGAVRELRERTAIRNPDGIESLEPVEIRGSQQWVLIRAERPDAPVLLFLHGGPGMPLLQRARYFDSRLVQHFVVVQWDQAGAGLSRWAGYPRTALRVERYVEDTLALVAWLRERFGVERIFLAGTSWGAMLGNLVVARAPESFHAWVSGATATDLRRDEAVGYEWLLAEARAARDDVAVAELEAIGPPPYRRLLDVGRQRTWLRRYGGVHHQPFPGYLAVTYGWASPEYDLLDVALAPLAELWSVSATYFQIVEGVDLLAQVPRLEVPVWFVHGRHDMNTPGAVAREFYEKLEAPKGKHWVWFESSAHMPHFEENAAYQRLLIEEVLPLAGPAAAAPR